MIFNTEEDVKIAFPMQRTGIIGPVRIAQSQTGVVEAIGNLKTQVGILFKDASLEMIPEITHWRNVYKKMGASPKYASSLESLATCYKEKGDIWSIHPIVDLYNWVSLACKAPMAAYDVSKIDGKVSLRFAKKGEPFTPLGNPKQTEKTKNGEVVYADDSKIVCRYWNYRDCHETRITPETSEVVFFVDLSDFADGSPVSVLSRVTETIGRSFGTDNPETQLV